MAKSAREYLEGEAKRLAEAAKSILDAAEAEGRAVTDKERSKVEDLIQEAKDVKARLQEEIDNENLRAAVEENETVAAATGGEPTVKGPVQYRDPGTAFVKNDAFKQQMERGLVGSWKIGPITWGEKLTDGDGNTIIAETGSPVFSPEQQVAPQVLPGIQGPVEQRLTVAALFGQGTATANSIVYLKETVTNNNAAVTDEGDPKPPSDLDFDKASEPVVKVATFLPIADEMLEDEPQVVSYINGRLLLFVQQAEEAYLVTKVYGVAGTGSSASEVDGDNVFDGIAAAIMHVRTDGGLEPDGLVCSPLDAAKMDVAKAVGSGVYFSGGPYAGAQQNPWGLRRVVTKAANDGSPIVGAFRDGATLWRKGGFSIQASNSHADFFRRDLTALRVEQRLALTIFREAAFQVASGS